MNKKQTELQTINEASPVRGEAETLIAQAIDKNVPVETMEKLLAMRNTLRAEQAKEQYDRAMAEFQGKCPVIEKTKQGYNYKYADLGNIVSQVKGLLSECGFSYSFDTDETEKGLIIYCKIKHIKGHTEISKAFIDRETTTKMNSSQQSGAIMTYGKRYAFVNALGILTGDEDTDAYENTPKQPFKRDFKATPIPVITAGQKSTILDLIYQTGKSRGELDTFLLEAYRKKLEELSFGQAERVIERLKPSNEVTEEDLDTIA